MPAETIGRVSTYSSSAGSREVERRPASLPGQEGAGGQPAVVVLQSGLGRGRYRLELHH